MSTEHLEHQSCVGIRWLGILILLIILNDSSIAPAAPIHVGADTVVRSLQLKGVQSLSESRLRRLLRTHDRGAAWNIRSALGKLPLIPSPTADPFDPRVLQEDVVRLREAYHSAGFIDTQVRYEVEAKNDDKLLDITIVVKEGRPLTISDVGIYRADSLTTLQVPPDLSRGWARLEVRAQSLIGGRFDSRAVLQERDRMRSWLRDRGYAQAEVTSRADQDSVHLTVVVRYLIDIGRRQRIGEILVEGNHSVSDHIIRRELPFSSGDLYSQRIVNEARSDLQQLQIVRASRLELLSPALADSLGASPAGIPVRLTIWETPPHLIAGELGYGTDSGLLATAEWNHRNFAGDARVLTISSLAQTGVLATDQVPDRRYRGGVTLQQPYLFNRRLSALLGPFIEYREDYRDRSLEAGANTTLVYRIHRLLSMSLDYHISHRKIYEYRLGELIVGDINLLTYLSQAVLDSQEKFEASVNTSLFTLSANLGSLDEIANPRKGILFKPSFQFTAPASFSSVNYIRGDGSVFGFLPLGSRFTLSGRASAGRLYPYGKSVPKPGETATENALALRDAFFTAGGSTDVRGWGYRLLGPKFPDIRVVQVADSLGFAADGYVPIGGLSRLSFSLELRMPLPPFGPKVGSHFFLDGGRVWTGDSRFRLGADEFDEERFFYATGGGIDLITPVGPLELSLGYKLNPSLPDLVNSGDLVDAILAGTPTDELERHNSHRWQFSLVFGTNF